MEALVAPQVALLADISNLPDAFMDELIKAGFTPEQLATLDAALADCGLQILPAGVNVPSA